jgi:hypothetical protein
MTHVRTPKTNAGCGKFALRGLSQSLAKEFHPAGVHIAHMIIDGAIGERRLVKTHHSTSLMNSSIFSAGLYVLDFWSSPKVVAFNLP